MTYIKQESSIHVLLIQKSGSESPSCVDLGVGYELSFAFKMCEAAEKLKFSQYDVVILDLALSEYQGVDALKALQSITDSLPIIVILPDDCDDLGTEAMRLGAQDYLVLDDLQNPGILKRILRYSIERNKNMMVLKNNENLIAHAQEIAKFGTWIWNIDTNEFEPSQAFVHIFDINYPISNKSVLHYLKYVRQDEREGLKNALLTHSKNGTPFSIEFQITTQEVHVKHILLKGELLNDHQNSSSRYHGTVQDVTELKITSEILNQKNRFLELSGEIAAIGGWELNLESQKLYWSDASYIIHGLSKDFELTISSVMPLFPKEYMTYIKEMYYDAIKHQKLFFIEVPIEKNNKTLWLQYIGKIVYEGSKPVIISGVVQDITSQRKQSEKIRVRAMMLNNVGDAVIAVNNEWKVIFWNSTAEKLCGFKREDVIGKPVADLNLIDVTKEEVFRVFSKLKDGQSFSGEYQIQHKDGRKFLGLASNSAVTNKDGEVEALVTIIRNISKEKESLQKLEESENRFRKLFEHSPVGTGLVDLTTKLWIDSNDKLLQLLGYSRKEFMKLSYIDITPSEYHAIDIEQGKQIYKRGSFGPYQKEYFKKDGSRVKVILTGFKLGVESNDMKVWTHVLDITELDAKTKSLRQSEERFRNYVENATDIIYTLDETGNITYISPNVVSVLGYHYNELKGMLIIDFVHPDDHRKLFKKLSEGLVKLNTKISVTIRIKNKVGNYVWMQSEGTMRKTSDGTLYGINVARDIDNKRKSELRIREQNRSLKHIAFVQSHILRRPLANILGLLNLKSLSKNGEIEITAVLDMIKIEAENMDKVVSEIVEKSTALNKFSEENE